MKKVKTTLVDTQEVEMSPNFKSCTVVIVWLVGHADDLWSNGCAAQDAACYHCGSGIRAVASSARGACTCRFIWQNWY